MMTNEIRKSILSTVNMRSSIAFLVVAVLLCIMLSAEASDVLRCTGERLSDGQFYFKMTFDLKEGVDDCETQWVINGIVAGFSEADGHTECKLPLLNATANTAVLQTCDEKLECLLICPSASINKREPCSCATTSSTTLPEVGLPDWRAGVWIGVSVAGIMLLSLIVTMLYKRKKKRSEFALSGPCPDSDSEAAASLHLGVLQSSHIH
ncbi:uncharacterized protein LOC113116450 isoform X1 [Carassius auratus]|uniref:Uncharacterized protein LOC113116450 isoform X1 n=1 Tax=Carassius auratus TaxID=7957 RepID=A0A6P6R4K9_CARAU|nr:uncharacterized protein LOC113116450 isoform X1 [Carassius auratus]XP_026140411.1 uncharacterized protein LOC113116450 isoform X1 [Carassius auratus]